MFITISFFYYAPTFDVIQEQSLIKLIDSVFATVMKCFKPLLINSNFSSQHSVLEEVAEEVVVIEVEEEDLVAEEEEEEAEEVVVTEVDLAEEAEVAVVVEDHREVVEDPEVVVAVVEWVEARKSSSSPIVTQVSSLPEAKKMR